MNVFNLFSKVVFCTLILQCTAGPVEQQAVVPETEVIEALPVPEKLVKAADEQKTNSILLGILGQFQDKSKPAVDAKPISPTEVSKEDSLLADDLTDKIPELPLALEPSRETPATPAISKNDTDSRSDFYVITAIFNPASYQSRYALYHDFAQHMKASGAQLVTIECIFPKLGQTEFKVTEKANPLHIQLRSDTVYWVKEDLINIAAGKLPENARWVSWLDADIFFHENDWVQRTIDALEHHAVVQMFKFAHFLNAEEEILRTDYSFGYSLVNGKPLLGFKEDDWYPHPGYGWAMSRTTFDKVGGLPDYDIIGGGDLYFAYTLVNHVSDVVEKDFEEEYKQKIIQKSSEIYSDLNVVSSVEGKTIAGYVPVTISHRWHGPRRDRGYVDRLNILVAHDFNYFTDMNREDNGLLSFANGTDSLQKDVECYFENRNEDDKNLRSQCNSREYTLFIASKPRPTITCPSHGGHHGDPGNYYEPGKPSGPGHHNEHGGQGEAGHYYGKTYTYYTTQHYHNVLDVKALESIVKLIKH